MSMSFIASDKFDAGEDTGGGVSRLPDFRYEEIKAVAADVIEKYAVSSIPIDVFALAKKLRIRLVRFSDFTEDETASLGQWGITEETDGFYLLAEKNGEFVPYIYYNDKKDPRRIRFTILHEIGHHLLSHVQQSDLAEAEANFFAKYLIAPPVLVHRIEPQDYLDIACAFDVSGTCAWNAFDYYEKWRWHYLRVGGRYEEYEIKILNACAV